MNTVQEIINRIMADTGIAVSRSRLYHYEKRGLLPDADRFGNNYRLFDEHDYNIIKLVVVLTDLGVGLDIIKAYLYEGDTTVAEVLKKKEDNLFFAFNTINPD